MNLILLQEGLRMGKRRLRVALKGTKRYPGTAKEICTAILEDCWNTKDKYLQVSDGHFCEFYMRDFAWIANSLIKLGKKEQAKATLQYALGKYAQTGSITTSINPQGKPFDFPYLAPDSLNYLLYSLRLLKAKELIREHKAFLTTELTRYYNTIIDKETGLIKRNTAFSSIRDHAVYDASCYDQVMAAKIAEHAKALHLQSSFKQVTKSEIKKRYWRGDYFLPDRSGATTVTADANLFPFWTYLFTEKAMLKKAFAKMEREGLTKPFPLQYVNKNEAKKQKMIKTEWFAKNYERDTIWMHMAPLYIEMLAKVDKEQARIHLQSIKEKIEQDRNYVEVYTRTGKPFATPFYYADEGMSWCANYLILAEELDV